MNDLRKNKDNKKILEILNELVIEKGISKIIMNYEIELNDGIILDEYNENYYNIFYDYLFNKNPLKLTDNFMIRNELIFYDNVYNSFVIYNEELILKIIDNTEKNKLFNDIINSNVLKKYKNYFCEFIYEEIHYGDFNNVFKKIENDFNKNKIISMNELNFIINIGEYLYDDCGSFYNNYLRKLLSIICNGTRNMKKYKIYIKKKIINEEYDYLLYSINEDKKDIKNKLHVL